MYTYSVSIHPSVSISPYLYLSHSISISISTRLLHTSRGPPLLSNLLPWEWIQTQAPHGPGRTCWCTFEALEPMTASLWKSRLLYSWIFWGTNLQMGGLLPSYTYIYYHIIIYNHIYVHNDSPVYTMGSKLAGMLCQCPLPRNWEWDCLENY